MEMLLAMFVGITTAAWLLCSLLVFGLATVAIDRTHTGGCIHMVILGMLGPIGLGMFLGGAIYPKHDETAG